MKLTIGLLLHLSIACYCFGQEVPPASDPRHYDIISGISAERIEQDIRTLVSFGTRHTLSDTVSSTRGIGAARRWMKAEFDRISAHCNGCLEISYMRDVVKGDPETRIKNDLPPRPLRQGRAPPPFQR